MRQYHPMSAVPSSATASSPSALRDEVVELTRELIRVDTTNGNETAAAEVLRERFAAVGVDAEIVARNPDRGNLVARIAGSGGGPSLAFVGHLDVVPADARDWRFPPFEAVIDDAGFLHGRGALDMKGEVAIRTVAMLELVRQGFQPRGDLTAVMVADEEDGSAEVGMNWLVTARPDLACDFALNEGGGAQYRLTDGRVVTDVSVGEKGTCPVRVDAVGEAGHASMPTLGANAVPRLAELLRRIDLGMPTPQRHPVVDQMLAALLGESDAEDLSKAVERGRALSPLLAHLLPALAGTTMAPTLLYGSSARNVLPARAGVELDCRVLPGTTPDEVEAAVRSRLDADGQPPPYELSFPEPMVPGSFSPAAGPLWDACTAAIGTLDRSLTPLPTLCTGFTDSTHLRSAFGTVAYGFSPLAATPAEVAEAGYHNADERIHVDDLLLGVQFHLDVARRMLS
jgi:acetylornithine deacetylase/succinyl-diaminopimelate desuccinylase-like protein